MEAHFTCIHIRIKIVFDCLSYEPRTAIFSSCLAYYVAESIFFENPQQRARHCIKLTRNAKNGYNTTHAFWLTTHSYNTDAQAHLAQPQPKNGEAAGHRGSKPRHNQLQQHDQLPKLPRPTYHIIRLEDEARDWQGVAKTWEWVDKRVVDGVHCALETHTLSSSRHRQGYHHREPSLAAKTAPSRRGRRCCAAAARSGKSDLGFPLASRVERLGPKTTPPRREMAPTGVTVVRNGRTEQGFHPGQRPPNGKMGTRQMPA